MTSVASAAEGYEAFQHAPPDVIVSDIAMPDEDGYSFLRRVRALEAGQGRKSVPAVALTAFAREEDRRKALESGFQRHVSKPADPMELVSLLARVAKNQ